MDQWTCNQCGRGGNERAFCVSCGAARPEVEAGQTVAAQLPPLVGSASAAAPPPAPGPAPQAPPVLPPTHYQGQAPAGMGNAVPDVPMLPGERTVAQEFFTPHLILSHLRSRVLLTDKRLVIQHPHALFGLFPMGYVVLSAPLDTINQVGHGHLLRSRRVGMGIAAVLFGLFLLVTGLGAYQGGLYVLLAVVAWAVGAALIITARVVGIHADSGGQIQLHANGRGGDLARVEAIGERIVAEVQRARGE